MKNAVIQFSLCLFMVSLSGRIQNLMKTTILEKNEEKNTFCEDCLMINIKNGSGLFLCGTTDGFLTPLDCQVCQQNTKGNILNFPNGSGSVNLLSPCFSLEYRVQPPHDPIEITIEAGGSILPCPRYVPLKVILYPGQPKRFEIVMTDGCCRLIDLP